MGMAASQVRFLSLQNRKNAIGLNLMTLSNRKTALSRDMNRVSAEYNNAMNQKVLKWSNNSGITYNDINYDLLMKPSDLNANMPYIVTDAQGRVVLDDNEIVLPGQSSGTGVTYRDIAMMISAYSGVDENSVGSTKTTYNNFDNLQGGTGFTSDSILNCNVGSKANSGSASSEKYVITNNALDMPASGLRYDIMTKLGLITVGDRSKVDALDDKINGVGCEEGGPYAPDSLKGKYYIAKINYDSYVDYMKHAQHNYSMDNSGDGSVPPWTFEKTEHATNNYGIVKYKDSVENNNGVINTVQYFTRSNPELSQLKLDAPLTGEAYRTSDAGVLTYTINTNGTITYKNTVGSLFAGFNSGVCGLGADTGMLDSNKYLNTVVWANGAIGQNDSYNHTWTALYNANACLMLDASDSSIQPHGGLTTGARNALNTYVTHISNLFKTNSAIVPDNAAADKAATSTYHFFIGDITNNTSLLTPGRGGKTTGGYWRRLGNMDSAALGAATAENLVGSAWTKRGDDHGKAMVNVRNLIDTFLTFYDYYHSCPSAQTIQNSSGATFTTTTVTPYTGPTDDNVSFTYDSSRVITFGGDTYEVKTYYAPMSDTDPTKDPNFFQREYWKIHYDSDGNIVYDSVVQTDTIFNNTADPQYSEYIREYNGKIYNLGSSTNMQDSIGGASLSEMAGTTTSTSSAMTCNVLVLNYTDAYGNAKESKLGAYRSQSVYATYTSATPKDQTQILADALAAAEDALNQALRNREIVYQSLCADTKGMDYFDALFKRIAESGWVYDESVNNPNDQEASKNYLNAKLQNNMFFISEVNTVDGTDFSYALRLARDVSKVFEVYDSDAQNVALSKYESEKADISSKEKLLDIRINKLETEQDVIKTELDSLKTIIKDNVDKTFKIFS